MDGYVGEVRMFAGDFAPRGWLLCQGQTVNVAQYQVLHSIIGTRYGGDGRRTFGIPDLRGRVAVGSGNGPGLSNYPLARSGGAEKVALSIDEMPEHIHLVRCSGQHGNQQTPVEGYPAAEGVPQVDVWAGTHNDTMAEEMIAPNGANMAHMNVQPFLAVNFIICANGAYPSRS